MNSTKADIPPTPMMLEALRLKDAGLPNAAIAEALGVNNRRVSALVITGSVRTGRPVVKRASPTPSDTTLRDRLARLEDRNQSLRQRLTNLEREVARLQRQLPPTVEHRRVADGGVGGRKERRAWRVAA